MNIKGIICKKLGFEKTDVKANHKEVIINISMKDINTNISSYLQKSEMSLPIGSVKFTSINVSCQEDHLIVDLSGKLTLGFIGLETVKDFNIIVKTIPTYDAGRIYISNTSVYHIDFAGISYDHKDKSEVVKILERSISKFLDGYEVINIYDYSTNLQNVFISSAKNVTLTEDGIICILDTVALTKNMKKILILKLVSLSLIVLIAIGVFIGFYTHTIQKILSYFIMTIGEGLGEGLKEVGEHPVGTAVHMAITAIL